MQAWFETLACNYTCVQVPRLCAQVSNCFICICKYLLDLQVGDLLMQMYACIMSEARFENLFNYTLAAIFQQYLRELGTQLPL